MESASHLEALRRAQHRAQQAKQSSILEADLFPLQMALVNDQSKRITCDSGRRSGKTHSIGRRLIKTAHKYPGDACLYASITKPHAVELMWRELVTYCEKHKIPIKTDLTRHIITYANGHRTIFGGVSSKDEREKARGFKWREVTLDETGSMGPYLGYFVEEVLEATLLDYDGTLALAGTPGPTAAGTYFDAVHDNSGTWSHHHWTVLDNPRIPQWAGLSNWKAIAAAFMDALRLKTPDAKFRREYLGEWVRDQDSLLYLLDPLRNYYDELPNHGYDYVIGADTGFNDASAIVVLAASRATNAIFVVDEWTKSGTLIDGLALQLKKTLENYPNAAMVIDPANKQLVESMKQIYSLPLQAADKVGKRAHIDVLNSALHAGTVKFKRKSPTYEQMSILEWNAKRTAESETFPADLADSMLYAYTHVYNHHNRKDMPAPLTELERGKEEERKMIEAAIAKIQGKDEDPLGFDLPDSFFNEEAM